jgi:hypothetical protein
MEREMRGLAFLTCVALVALCAYGQALVNLAKPSKPIRASTRLQLVAELDPSVAKSGDRVFARLKLTNIHSKNVIMVDSEPQMDYEIAITDAGGKEPPLSEWGKKNAAGQLFSLKQSELDLEPGQEAEVRVEVTKAYQPLQPGTYYARVTRLGVWTEFAEDNTKVYEVAHANPVQLIVTP